MELVAKYDSKGKLMNAEVVTLKKTGAAINGTFYEYNKAGVVASFISYLKQEIVWEDWKTWVLEFAEWLKVEKPELFTSSSSYNYSIDTSSSSTKKNKFNAADANPRTQKAKGIKFISDKNAGFGTLPFEILTGEERDESAVDNFIAEFSTVFARPCPEVPRHGFVDSRKVTGKEAIQQLFREVKEVDPNGELVIMEPVEADLNCVITGNSITVGVGHDGATTGKNARTFPIFGTWEKGFGDISKAGIAEDSVPYLETVTKGDKHYLVQMRGGPAITSRAVDYVPEQMTVKEVIKAEGDLLEWETIMQNNAGRVGVVVDHSNGALTSHYGVHAILNKIPVLTSRSPVVGETLQVVDDTVTPDYMAVTTGILDSLITPFVEKKKTKRVTAMIYATQYFSVLGGTDAYFVGYAVGTMLSFGLAACGGEYRHHANNPDKGKSRNQVYTEATEDFMGARMKLAKWARSFAVDTCWSSSYGGPKWFDCADAIIQLDTVTRKFLRFPNERRFKAMMMAMNRAINCAHNGGWWFNKFINQSVFDNINSEKLPTILNAVTYMFNTPMPKLTLAHLDMYQRYSNAKVVDPKLEKSHAMQIVAAQIRPVAHDSTGFTVDNIGTAFRLQIKYDNGQFTEKNVEMAASNWPFGQEQFTKSFASSVSTYIPVQFEQQGENWVITLNGLELHKESVQYGYAPLETIKKTKKAKKNG
jgi:hypothetical protein